MIAEIGAGAAGVLVGGALIYALRRPTHAPVDAPQTGAADGAAAPETARVVAALPFAAFTVDARARVRAFNAAAEALFDVSAERAVGRAVIEVVPSVEVERMVAGALQGETRSGDVAFGRGTRERSLGITVQPYADGAVAIATDRTQLLAGERVRRDFTGNVSHELRTPLSAMKLMIETLAVADDVDEARAIFLPRLGDEVDRMIRIVEDLLEIARSESGLVPLRRTRFDLGALAHEAAGTFSEAVTATGVDLRVEAQPLAIVADREQLRQVFVNLLDNALRHTPSTGRVSVGVHREADDAVIVVRDTGIGIASADLPRVFERFYVVDRSRSRERAGTGLGLAIVKHLVEAHGGTIGVDSVYGHGATFTVRLPLRPDGIA